MSRTQTTAALFPDCPHDPIRSGIFASARAAINIRRSRLTASRLYFATPVAKYAAPLSVEPASSAMTFAPAAMPRWTSSMRTPTPSDPTGTRTVVLAVIGAPLGLVSNVNGILHSGCLRSTCPQSPQAKPLAQQAFVDFPDAGALHIVAQQPETGNHPASTRGDRNRYSPVLLRMASVASPRVRGPNKAMTNIATTETAEIKVRTPDTPASTRMKPMR